MYRSPLKFKLTIFAPLSCISRGANMHTNKQNGTQTSLAYPAKSMHKHIEKITLNQSKSINHQKAY